MWHFARQAPHRDDGTTSSCRRGDALYKRDDAGIRWEAASLPCGDALNRDQAAGLDDGLRRSVERIRRGSDILRRGVERELLDSASEHDVTGTRRCRPTPSRGNRSSSRHRYRIRRRFRACSRRTPPRPASRGRLCVARSPGGSSITVIRSIRGPEKRQPSCALFGDYVCAHRQTGAHVEQQARRNGSRAS